MFRISTFLIILGLFLVPQAAFASVCLNALYKGIVDINHSNAVKAGYFGSELQNYMQKYEVGRSFHQAFMQDQTLRESDLLTELKTMARDDIIIARENMLANLPSSGVESLATSFKICTADHYLALTPVPTYKPTIANAPAGGPSMMAQTEAVEADAGKANADGQSKCLSMRQKENSNGFWVIRNECGFRVVGQFCYVGDKIFGCDAKFPGSFGPLDNQAETMVSGPGSDLVATGKEIEWRVSFCEYEASNRRECIVMRPQP